MNYIIDNLVAAVLWRYAREKRLTSLREEKWVKQLQLSLKFLDYIKKLFLFHSVSTRSFFCQIQTTLDTVESVNFTVISFSYI